MVHGLCVSDVLRAKLIPKHDWGQVTSFYGDIIIWGSKVVVNLWYLGYLNFHSWLILVLIFRVTPDMCPIIYVATWILMFQGDFQQT